MGEFLNIYSFDGFDEYVFKLSRDYKIISFYKTLENIVPDICEGADFAEVFGLSREECARIFSDKEYTECAILYNEKAYHLNIVNTAGNEGSVYIVSMKNIRDYGRIREEELITQNRLHDILNKMPVFYARYIVTDTIKLIEASDKLFEFYNTTPEDYEDDIFFGVLGISREQADELVEMGKKRMPVSFDMKTYRQQNPDKIVYVQVRANCVWEMNGYPVYFAIFIDITDQKEMENALRYEKERYKIAMDSTKDIMYEYDVKNDVLVTYGDIDGMGGSGKRVENFIKNINTGTIVYIDDIEKITNYFKEGGSKFAEDGSIVPVELRLIREYGILWVNFTGIFFESRFDDTVRIIGRIQNIHEEKLKELKELENSYKDKLTGLLKQARGEQLIKNYLARKGEDVVCSAFIIDLDNFGEINNSYSFLFGDTVLQDVAAILLKEAGEGAVVSRIGGDEFLVFRADTGREEAERIAGRICEGVSKIYTGENIHESLSCSIGTVSSDIVDYDEIIRCVERAAVYVKQNGKNGFKSYYDLPDKEHSKLARMISLERKLITSDSIYSERDDSIIEFAFDLLEKTRDLRSAIKLLLARIGKYYDFDRISIIDVDSDFLVCSAAYRWDIMKGVTEDGPIIRLDEKDIEKIEERLRIGVYIVSDDSGDYEETFVNRICEREKNHVMLVNPMYERGKFVGVCVYEDFNEERVWDRKTQNDIKEITKIIATHMSRENADFASNVKAEFISRMSHNIKTPMNAITGMTEIARRVIDDREKTINCLDKIEISTRYLINLINDILDMSSIESGRMEIKREPFMLDDVIKVVKTVMEEKARNSGVDFHIYMDYGNRCFIGDGVRLNQALVNIVNNAVKFTAVGGRVDVKVCQLQKDGDEALIRFDVTDTGVGISDEDMHRIFKMFEQGGEKGYGRRAGSGIGLAITSNIVRLMGGRLNVESKPGEGSNFWFELRLRIFEEKKNSENKKEEYNFKGKRILLVEDDELNAEIAQTLLELAGFEVELAENGRIAVDMFRDNPAHYYDCILMDIRMPVMNGLDATRNIRILDKEDARSVPIVAHTAETFTSDEKRSVESGMNAHLSKPLNTKILYSVLNNLIK
ncbi:MAG: response regulator [Oscillospiraceae bacterium]|nr:response regulator [Oscillospiraceae bacterium]